MAQALIRNQAFGKLDSNESPLAIATHENCTFVHGVFSHRDLSMASLANTVFRDVAFRACKMLGLHMEDCSKFGLLFGFED